MDIGEWGSGDYFVEKIGKREFATFEALKEWVRRTYGTGRRASGSSEVAERGEDEDLHLPIEAGQEDEVSKKAALKDRFVSIVARDMNGNRKLGKILGDYDFDPPALFRREEHVWHSELL